MTKCCFSQNVCCEGCITNTDCNDPLIMDIDLICRCDGTCGNYECDYVADCSIDYQACDDNEYNNVCCNGVCTRNGMMPCMEPIESTYPCSSHDECMDKGPFIICNRNGFCAQFEDPLPIDNQASVEFCDWNSNNCEQNEDKKACDFLSGNCVECTDNTHCTSDPDKNMCCHSTNTCCSGC